MNTYYTLLGITPKATAAEVEATFRRFVARYRTTVTVEDLFTDTRFATYLNAYLTLRGPLRAGYDATPDAAPPEPLQALPTPERRLLMAHIAYWRREQVEAIHLLRGLLEKEPELAEGWALLGEVFFAIDKLEEGIAAYEKAAALDAAVPRYAARLQHARDALAGKGELRIEASPEEELAREERLKRAGLTVVLLLAALGLGVWGWRLPRELLGLGVPWKQMGALAGAVAMAMFALAQGRLLAGFERTMLNAAMSASDRTRARSYPYGLILFAASAASLWLGAVAMLVMALIDEDWPGSPAVLFGLCAAVTAGVAFSLHVAGIPWVTTAIFGGNPIVLAGMFGWWMGSLGRMAME
jgi:hypothetical protein